MATGKTNNPKGINQYTNDGKSPANYRYSIGGYFATKKKQSQLDTQASFAKAEASQAKSQISSIDSWLPKNKTDLEATKTKVDTLNNMVRPNRANKLTAEANVESVRNMQAKGVKVPPALAQKTEESLNTTKLLQGEIFSRSFAAQAEYNEKSYVRALKLSQRKTAEQVLKQSASTVKSAEAYKSVSDPKAYAKNLLNQTKNDIRGLASTVKDNIYKKETTFKSVETPQKTKYSDGVTAYSSNMKASSVQNPILRPHEVDARPVVAPSNKTTFADGVTVTSSNMKAYPAGASENMKKRMWGQ